MIAIFSKIIQIVLLQLKQLLKLFNDYFVMLEGITLNSLQFEWLTDKIYEVLKFWSL